MFRFSLLLALATCVFVVSAEGAERAVSRATTWRTAPRTVFVQLFQWKWTDIAQECQNFFGPAGFAAVQVPPPSEHVVLPGAPWYERYQPVSYKLDSRSGTRAEFIAMVRRCKAVGVDVYVDAIINHMAETPPPGEVRWGFAGTPYSNFKHPGLWEPWDFNNCGRHGDNMIRNWNDRWEVQHCDLFRTNDLKTSSDYVRGRLAEYLNELIEIGVAGFRVDASKHMAAQDIENILQRLHRPPYIVHEMIGNDSEPIKMSEYFPSGDVNEFAYGRHLGRVFKQGKLAWLETFGERWGMIPSEKAVVFTDNHDTQRDERGPWSPLTYKDGSLYVLANVFMLAWPYGYPQLLSGYSFTTREAGPPMFEDGSIMPVYVNGKPERCYREWNCEHRWRPIANMVAFRNYTASDFRVTKWWSDGNNRIAFGRGDKGYVVINNDAEPVRRWFDTGLPAGKYCDIITGTLSSERTCTGKTIVVNQQGWAAIEVGAFGAAAVFGGAMPVM